MSSIKKGSRAWYAHRYTERHGMHLVPLRPNGKAPLSDSWELHRTERPTHKIVNGKEVLTKGPGLLRTPEEAVEYFTKNPTHNMGFSMMTSGFCSLDVDCKESFAELLADFGLEDEAEELLKMPTIVGDPAGYRILFRVPDGVSLDLKSLVWPSREDPDGSRHRELMRQASEARKAGNEAARVDIIEKARKMARYTVFELRAVPIGGTDARQDVLPPSLHPKTGEPYRWVTQPARCREEWPEPPPWLLAIWEAWDDFEPQFKQACPWAPRAEEAKPAPAPRPLADGDVSPIEVHLSKTTLTEALLRYGYQQKGSANRWLAPTSSSKIPGVYVDASGTRCFSHHQSDPLQGRPINAFDLFCHYDHGGDASAAVRELSQRYGLMRKKRELPPSIDERDLPAVAESEPDAPPKPAPAAAKPPTTKARSCILERMNAPFRALGYNGDRYYYLPRGTGQIASIRRGSHTAPAEMIGLGTLEWWINSFAKDPDKPERGVDWQLAASVCMRACEERGVYDSKNIKGSGAWFDKRSDSAIVHLGDRLLVDGVETPVHEYEGRYTFQKDVSIEGKLPKPATDDEGRTLLEICDRLKWRSSVHGMLFSGWLALAAIGGAMAWRPHVWLSGEQGAGKTWVIANVAVKLLGDVVAPTQGGTSEAGIRQGLQSRSLPVLRDEAESQNKKSKAINEAIVELMRQSSSENAHPIIKGSASGEPVSYTLGSMFMFSSIGVVLDQASDKNRVTVLHLMKDRSNGFPDLKYLIETTLTDDFCARIRARQYYQIKTIRKNANTLAEVIGALRKSRRIGDQIGTLIAGYISLQHTEELTKEQAELIANSIDLDALIDYEEETDERRLLSIITQHTIPVETDRGRPRVLSIDELIQRAAGRNIVHLMDIGVDTAQQALMRWGIRVDSEGATIANTHAGLSRILADTAWSSGWNGILERMPGATKPKNGVRYQPGKGGVSRGLTIPIENIGLEDWGAQAEIGYSKTADGVTDSDFDEYDLPL